MLAQPRLRAVSEHADGRQGRGVIGAEREGITSISRVSGPMLLLRQLFQKGIRRTPAQLFFFFSYMNNLHTYLLDAIHRSSPLESGRIAKVLKSVEKEFDHQWSEGAVEGWQKTAAPSATQNGDAQQQHTNGESSGSGIWCAACESPAPHAYR